MPGEDADDLLGGVVGGRKQAIIIFVLPSNLCYNCSTNGHCVGLLDD